MSMISGPGTTGLVTFGGWKPWKKKEDTTQAPGLPAARPDMQEDARAGRIGHVLDRFTRSRPDRAGQAAKETPTPRRDLAQKVGQALSKLVPKDRAKVDAKTASTNSLDRQVEALKNFSLPEPEPGWGDELLGRMGLPVEGESKPISRKGSIASSVSSGRGPLVSSGPVFNPDTGHVDRESLRRVANGLIDVLPALPDGAPAVRSARRERLLDDLRQIARLGDDRTLTQAELGLKLRDLFARAAADAQKLSVNLEGSRLRRMTKEPQQALAYSCLAAVLTELKRTHLTGAAASVWDDYAQQAAAEMEKTVPGLKPKVSGAVLSKTQGGSVGWGNGLAHAEGSAARSETWLRDDDRNLLFWKAVSLIAGGGAGDDINDWGIKGGGKGSVALGKVFFEAEELSDMIKLVGYHKAGSSWGRSAGPRTRAAMKKLQQLDAWANQLVGRASSTRPGAPHYLGPKKLAKGFNATNLESLSGTYDRLCGHGNRLGALMHAGYPPIEQQVRERLEANGKLPVDPIRHAIPRPESLASPSKLVPIHEGNLYGYFAAGKTSGTSNLEGRANFAFNARYQDWRIHIWDAKLGHELMSVAYSKDFAQVFQLHWELEAVLKTKHSKAHAKLALYRDFAERLGGRTSVHLKEGQLSDADRLHYGPTGDIPRQFHASIAQPDLLALNRARQACEELRGTCLGLVGEARKLLAVPNAHMDSAQKEELARRKREAFDAINHRIWSGKFPGGQEAALKDPEGFVAQSVDATSLALGVVGTHLALLKRGLVQQPTMRTDDVRADIELADAAYDNVHKLLDEAYLPIERTKLLRDGSLLEGEAKWRRHRLFVQGGVKAGASAHTIKAIARRLRKGGMGDVSVDNSAGTLGASAEVQLQEASEQVRPSRMGKFIQFTFTVQGGAPLVGQAAMQAMLRGLEKLYPGVKPTQLEMQAAEILRQVQGMSFDVSDGTAVVVKLRKAQVGGRRYDLQYWRPLRTKDGGLGLKVPFVTPVGKFEIGVQNKDSVQAVTGMEVMGPDLSYLMMQHPRLTAVLEQAQGGRSLGDVLLEPSHLDVRNGYFGRADTIPTVIDRFIEYERAMREAERAGRQIDMSDPPNELFRYFAGDFTRISKVARQAAADAPGSTAQGTDPFAPAGDWSAAGLGLPGGFDWAKARRDIAALKTVDDRVRYYSTEGRPVLDAFSRIVQTAREIDTAAIFHVPLKGYGFDVHLKDSKLKHDAQRVLDAAAGRTARPSLWRRAGSAFNHQAAAARRLTDRELRLLAGNPNASPEVAKEIRRRENEAQVRRPQPITTPSSNPFSSVHSAGATSTVAPETAGLRRRKVPTTVDASEAARIVLAAQPSWMRVTNEAGGDLGLVAGTVQHAPRQPSTQRERERDIAAAADNRARMTALHAPTLNWLANHGLRAVHNSGSGMNCLIMSLLQHARQDYGHSHEAEAAKLRATLDARWGEALARVPDRMLYPDDHVYVWLVNEINRRHGSRLNVIFVQPGEGGIPLAWPGVRTGDRDVVVYFSPKGGGHYEAVVPSVK